MALLGIVLFGVYACVIPHKLFKALIAAYRADRLWDNEDFLESHGWLVLKYKPKRYAHNKQVCVLVLCHSR